MHKRIQYVTQKSDFVSDSPQLVLAPQETASIVEKFHQSIPGYSPSPLVQLPRLAGELGISKLFIKDESRRFSLNSFKILGASYAMARTLMDIFQLKKKEITFTTLVSKKKRYKDITFVTATDGNHGAAVGWFAEKIGCNAVIFLPKGTSKNRLKELGATGAVVSITEGNYDDTVLFAKKIAQENDWILLQDTAWEGYKKIPTWIMQGYFTILSEFISQEKTVWPTHIFVQAGVGSFAAAMLSFLSRCCDRPMPVFTVVEPLGAPCYFNSIQIGDNLPHRTHGSLQTIMTGLSCGQPSLLGWEILNAAADAFIACSDEIASHGMNIYANPVGNDPGMTSGASGAVTLGLVYEILFHKKYTDLKEKLRLDVNSKILLISTEGNTSS